jgi:hypothetical protein
VQINLSRAPVFVAKDALNGTNGNVGLIEDGCPEMPKGVIAEVPNACFFTKSLHDMLALSEGSCNSLAFLAAPIPMPEHPRNCLVAVIMTA